MGWGEERVIYEAAAPAANGHLPLKIRNASKQTNKKIPKSPSKYKSTRSKRITSCSSELCFHEIFLVQVKWDKDRIFYFFNFCQTGDFSAIPLNLANHQKSTTLSIFIHLTNIYILLCAQPLAKRTGSAISFTWLR